MSSLTQKQTEKIILDIRWLMLKNGVKNIDVCRARGWSEAYLSAVLKNKTWVSKEQFDLIKSTINQIIKTKSA